MEEIKQLMNPNSLMFEADSKLDRGDFFPLLEPCVVAFQKKAAFEELHFGYYMEAIVIVLQQNINGENNVISRINTTYSLIQQGKKIVEQSIINN
jgi:hypothetical protein